MFSRIARRYDLVNTVLSFGRDEAWRRGVVRRALDRPGLVVLDLCCGTGKVAFACAEATNRPRAVIATDFSIPMLRVAVERRERRAVAGRVHLVCADALRSPVPDASVDIITCAFGIRNLSDVEAGLREAARCLRPGGKLIVMEFMHPGRRWTRRLVSWYIKRVIPLVGGLIAGSLSAYRYLPASIDRFFTVDQMSDLLERCGFSAVEAVDHSLGICTAFQAIRD